jgi:hypothetical protein
MYFCHRLASTFGTDQSSGFPIRSFTGLSGAASSDAIPIMKYSRAKLYLLSIVSPWRFIFQRISRRSGKFAELELPRPRLIMSSAIYMQKIMIQGRIYQSAGRNTSVCRRSLIPSRSSIRTLPKIFDADHEPTIQKNGLAV